MPVCDKCKGKKTVIMSAEESGLGIGAEVNCPKCKGTGEFGNPNACTRCNDSKKVVLSAEESPLRIPMEVDCPKCSALEKL